MFCSNQDLLDIMTEVSIGYRHTFDTLRIYFVLVSPGPCLIRLVDMTLIVYVNPHAREEYGKFFNCIFCQLRRIKNGCRDVT